MARIDCFKVVIFDFDGVDEIGQAFADEIFRVFHLQHHEIEIRYINAECASPSFALATAIIGPKSQSDERAALFGVRVYGLMQLLAKYRVSGPKSCPCTHCTKAA